MTDPRVPDLLAFLDSSLNDLVVSLERSRHRLTPIQQQAQADATLLGNVGEALAALRKSERVLADIQHHIEAFRRQSS